MNDAWENDKPKVGWSQPIFGSDELRCGAIRGALLKGVPTPMAFRLTPNPLQRHSRRCQDSSSGLCENGVAGELREKRGLGFLGKRVETLEEAGMGVGELRRLADRALP